MNKVIFQWNFLSFFTGLGGWVFRANLGLEENICQEIEEEEEEDADKSGQNTSQDSADTDKVTLMPYTSEFISIFSDCDSGVYIVHFNHFKSL